MSQAQTQRGGGNTTVERAPSEAQPSQPSAVPGGVTRDNCLGPARGDHVRAERDQASSRIQQSLRVWRKGSGAAPNARAQIPQGGGSSLPSGSRTQMEPKLGADLSGVRVHTGADSARAAADLGARAFTVGRDVHFGAGQYQPGTREGDRLLAHELTHVAQQGSEVQCKPDGAHEVSEPGDGAEHEADASADRITAAIHDAPAAGAHAAEKPSAKPAPVAASRESDWRTKMTLRGDKIHRAVAPTQAGATNAQPQQPAANPNEPVATLTVKADTETVDRTKLTYKELMAAQVGHAWITLTYHDVSKVPATVGAPTQALLRAGGTSMGMWPQVYRPEQFDPNYAARTGQMAAYRAAQQRIAAGQTTAAGGVNDPNARGFSTNPFNSYVPGRVDEPDTAHTAKGQIQYQLTQAQVDALLGYVNSKRGAQYSLYFFNCTTFAVQAAQAAGQSPPSGAMFGVICLPNALYAGILAAEQHGDPNATTTALGTVERDGQAVPETQPGAKH